MTIRIRSPLRLRSAALLTCILSGAAPVHPEPQDGRPDADLVDTVTALDAALFDAYNTCDLEAFRGFLAEELEFYHDLDGRQTDREVLVEALRTNICGKVRRELVPGSLEVFPMRGYGALQTGVHLFHHPGREEIDGIGQGRFIHLWQEREDGWKVTRIFSYDHRPLEEPAQ